jgi:hypothetical protein
MSKQDIESQLKAEPEVDRRRKSEGQPKAKPETDGR